MPGYLRPTNLISRRFVTAPPLAIAFVLMMVLGSTASALLLPAATDTGIARQQAEVPNQPVQPPGTVTANASAQTVEVTVTVHWCPLGTNPDTVQSGETIKPTCTLQGPPINVALTRISGDTTVPMTRAISSFPGTATYVNVQPGTYALLGYHVQAEHKSGLFCSGTTPDGNTRPYARVVEERPVDMMAGEKITCDWFGELSGSSTVTLKTWNCPEGFDFAAAGYDTAKQDCTEPVNPAVSFELTNASVTPPYEKTVESSPEATEKDVPPGSLTVTETVQQDTSLVLVAVVCTATSTVDPDQDTVDQVVPLSGANTFDLTVPAQGTLICDVFHTAGAGAQSTPVGSPIAAGMSVTVYTWECAPGTLIGQPMAYYRGEEQCEGEKLDVQFDVTDDNGTQQTTSASGGRQIDQLKGEVTITVSSPMGYEAPAIFCSSPAGQPGQHITGTGDSITLPPGAGDYQCSFYNIPGGVSPTGTGDVLVYTHVCASTPPPDAMYAWYHQNCTTRQNGATFVLGAPDTEIEATAGDVLDGAVTMRGLEPGNYSLDETVMIPDHESAAVFCAPIGKVEIPGPAQMLPQQLSGNTISVPVDADSLFYCQWYHAPTNPASPPAQ